MIGCNLPFAATVLVQLMGKGAVARLRSMEQSVVRARQRLARCARPGRNGTGLRGDLLGGSRGAERYAVAVTQKLSQALLAGAVGDWRTSWQNAI